MMGAAELWIETLAMLAAVLLIPIYMGFIHLSPLHMLAYAGLGGLAMAIGEDLQFRAGPWDLQLWDILPWAVAIAVAGGAAYVLALIFI